MKVKEPKILVANRDLVLPGQALAVGPVKPGDYVYVDKKGVLRSTKVGLADIKDDEIRVVPLAGGYIPREGDLVIGTVSKVAGNTILVNINSAYMGIIIPPRGLRGASRAKYNLSPGDVVLAKVKAFNGASTPLLSIEGEGLGKLQGGRIYVINPTRVPRVIGKRQSMLMLLRDKLGPDIIVGQNGVIWFNPRSLRHALLFEKILQKIEREAHVSGLSDRVLQLIESSGLDEGSGSV